MTTIVTTHSEQYATMFGDSGITDDYNQVMPDMNKIIIQDTWLIAACGEDRICDVLQYVVKYPKVPQYLLKKPIEDWYPWIVTQVAPKIVAAIEKTMPKVYRNSIGESSLLLVTHGKPFLISENLGVTNARPYWSVGSGSSVALGALANAVKAANWETEHYLHAGAALEAAKKHDVYTRGNVSGWLSYPDGNLEYV